MIQSAQLFGHYPRQVDDISKLLWGDRMPSQTLSDKLKRVYDDIDRWRTRPLESEYPYVFMDGVWHKRSWGGSVENVSVLVAIGVNAEGHREVIGVTEGMREDAASVYGQINVYSVTTKSERYERSYWTRTAAGNGIGGRKAPVPYGS